MGFAKAIGVLVLFLVSTALLILAIFGSMYLASSSPARATLDRMVHQSGDWCGTTTGQGPDGIDAVLCVSSRTSRFVLVARPSMDTGPSMNDDCLIQHGHIDTIQSWARSEGSVSGEGVYDFFPACGVPNTSQDCRFGLSMMGGTPLTLVPAKLDKPMDARGFLPVREKECPSGIVCGSGLYGFFRQQSMVNIQQWYGLYTDRMLTAAINFRGPDFSQYTLAIARGDDVQLCHGRRQDLVGMNSFDDTMTFVDLSTAFPIVSGACHLVFSRVSPDELPLPMTNRSDVTSFIESDRVLRAILSPYTDLTNGSHRNLIGRSLEHMTIYI